MTLSFFKRVPWGKFFLLWFLAVLMGTSLLWLHFGFAGGIVLPSVLLAAVAGAGLLWATTRPRWEKAHCSWCGAPVRAKALVFDRERPGWKITYGCPKCGHWTEKRKEI